MDKEATIARAGSMAYEGAKPEKVIAFLHEAGFNQVDSMLALRRAFAMSVADAKEAMAKSPTWAGSRERLDEAAEEASQLVALEQRET